MTVVTPGLLLLGFIVSSILAVFLLIRKGEAKNKVFAMFCGSLALYDITMYLIFFTNSEVVALFYYKLSMIGGILALATFAHFTLLYTKEENKSLAYVFYGISLIFSIINLGNGFFSGVFFGDGRYREILNFGYTYFTFYLALCVIFVVYRLFYYEKHAKDQAERNRTHYLLVLLLILAVSVVLDLLRNANLLVLVDALLMQYTIILFIIGVTYSIIKYHLLNIKVILRKSALYSIIGVVVLLVFELIKMALDEFLIFFFGANNLASKLSVLAIAFLFEPIRNRTERIFDSFVKK